MARKSRVKNLVQEVKSEEKIYNTAVYARLSTENNGKVDNINSIENQINICKNYIEENESLRLINTYIDNGFSGTNFNRPQFLQLIKDINYQKINCIVVKDLSRFGRDYIEIGNYLENIFPKLSLRFIAINDNYDSENSDSNLDIIIKNIINTFYAKDISKKVITSYKTRILSENFKRNTAPFGYKLSENKCNLIIDEKQAKVVKLIYDLRFEGRKIQEIIAVLTENKMLNSKGLVNWKYSTIQNILKNESYIGNTILGKNTKAFYKGQCNRTVQNSDKWIVIKNTHKSIISNEIFKKIQADFEKNKRK